MSSAPVEPPDTTGPSGESKPADIADRDLSSLSAHLLAAAVTELYPDAQCGIGPPTDDGFFYDFLVAKPFTPEDLAAIEKKMAHIVKQNRPIEKKLIPKPEALEIFKKKGQTLKCQLIEEKAATWSSATPWASSSTSASVRTSRRRGRSRRVQAEASPRRRLLARRRGEPVRAAHLRHGLRTKDELDATSPARGGQAPRPPQAGHGAGPVLDRRRERARA